MKKYDKLILACVGMSVLSNISNTSAQETRKDSTVNRTVVVENQYNPEVMDAFKVNVLPKIEEPAVAKKQIDYATAGRPLASFPINTMDAITMDIEQKKAKRGYLRAAYGNRNNTNIKGSYLWNMTDRDQIDVMASFYGYSGNMSSGYEFDGTTGIPEINGDKEWKHRFFRTDVSLNYSHTFSKVKMDIGGAFASQAFKYMPCMDGELLFANEQNFNLGEGNIGMSSVEGALPVEFGLKAGFRGFGYGAVSPLVESISEKAIHTEGYAWGGIGNGQKIGVGFSMDNMIYGKILKNFSLVKIKPGYRLETDYIKFQAGVNLDFQTGYASGFKVSPDVRLDYNFAGSFVLYANVAGGTKLNDFRALNDVSPYWLPVGQAKTSYTPYDLSLGVKGSPVNGLGLDIYGGYKETKDELFSMPFAEKGGVFNSFAQSKAKVAYAAFAMDYNHRDMVDFGIGLGYFNWKAQDGMDALLWLKPEYQISASARVKIFDGLHASVKYLYEGRVSTLGKRTDAVNELNIGADYNLDGRFNVFAGFGNLLNSKYITETGYPVQGFNVMAGVSVNF